MLMGSGCFTRSHQKSFPCCAPICSDNLRWFTSEGMNNALARKTRLARTRSSPYGLCWLHVLYCFILFYRVLRFHGDVTCFMWDIMVRQEYGKNPAYVSSCIQICAADLGWTLRRLGDFGDWADDKATTLSCRGHPRWFPWLGEEIWWQPGVKGQWPSDPVTHPFWNLECSALSVHCWFLHQVPPWFLH